MMACQKIDEDKLYGMETSCLQKTEITTERDSIVKILLRHHADLSLKDAHGNTAMHLAVEADRPGALKVFM